MNKIMVLEFIASINSHDVDGIIRYIPDDHVFIDAQDNEFKGKDRLREGWVEGH
jgi:ketosteroid isomerase-like protein